MNIDHILARVKRKDRNAQKALYDAYAPVLMAIAMRYMKDIHKSEDMVAEAFMKIFTKIHSFNEKGSFEGWMKRITVNECLMEIRKEQRRYLYISTDEIDVEIDPEIISKISEAEILQAIRELPEGYRTVFNMYVIEGFKHKEIAKHLDISINTSKSQLIMAKKKLRSILKKTINTEDHESLDSYTG